LNRTILVVAFTDLKRDPRVNRQIEALRPHYNVVAAGACAPGQPGVRFLPCAPASRTLRVRANEALELLSRRYDAYYWSQSHVAALEKHASGIHFDLVIANDIDALPVALKIARGAKVIFDAHEYAPREFEDKLTWRLVRQRYIEHLCRSYLSKVSAMTTVADSLACEYERQFGVHAEVVHSAPRYQPLTPSSVSPQHVRMVHHGGAIPQRRIELMVELMGELDERFTLDLVLVPTVPRYLEALRRMASRDRRIRILPPVEMSQLVAFGNSYDVGLFLLPPSNFNYQHALPNKFFEFIQSRLAVAIGPSPEMAKLVKRYGCGIVATDFKPASLARALNRLNADDLTTLKKCSHVAASELCFEQASLRFLGLVSSMLADR
jgi:hypothetical protein